MNIKNTLKFTVILLVIFSNLKPIEQFHFALTGPASSGKTTVSESIKETFGNLCHIIPEAATIVKIKLEKSLRERFDEKLKNRELIVKLTEELIEELVTEQIKEVIEEFGENEFLFEIYYEQIMKLDHKVLMQEL